MSTQTTAAHAEDAHINESILNEQILADQKKNLTDHMKYLPDMEQIDPSVMDQVISAMQAYDYDQYTEEDVKRALRHEGHISLEDFAALLSPAAKPRRPIPVSSFRWIFSRCPG